MNQWLRRLDLRRNRALLLQAALLLVPPVTAFYLMQFILGAYPWQMSLGVVVANDPLNKTYTLGVSLSF